MVKLSAETQLGSLIENPFGDKYLFSVNRKKFKDLDYYTQFNQEFANTFEQKDTLYIIVGTDSGLLVKQLLKTPPKQGSAYLFIEFPEIIELTQSQYDLRDQERIIVTTEEQWEEKARAIGMDIYFIINRVRQIKSFSAQYHYLAEYLFLWKTVEDRINHLSWQYQSQLGSKTFMQKQLENIAENHSPAVLLKDYFHGKNALILAGGPSLDNHIEWIRENQQHYLVIAVSRIARRLLETGIKPDIFISVDPYPINFDVSKEIFHFEEESLLVHQFHVSPMLLGNWRGNNLYLGKALPWESKLNLENFDGIGPTVTNTAILFAIQAGIKEQVLFGVDLCYNPQGFTHAKGSKENDQGPVFNEIGQKVITNNGDYAETNSAYYDAISTIEQLAELALGSGGRIINPSEHSAKMKNVEYRAIHSIAISKENISIKAFLEQLSEQQNSTFKIKHYKQVLKELEKAQNKVKKLISLARKGLEYNDKLFENNDPSGNFKYKLKMDKIEKELNHKNYVDFSELAKKFGVNEFLYFLNTDTTREMSNEEIRISGQTYYKALETGAKELERHIFTAINRTEIRLLENNALKVDKHLFKRHLACFDQSLLLERQISAQQNLINSNINKWSEHEKAANHKTLEQLIKNKYSTIEEAGKLYKFFINHHESLGTTEQERIQTVSFFILMLQNEENYQTRRLLTCAEHNPGLFHLPEGINILDNKPVYYIQKHRAINNIIKPEEQSIELLKTRNIIANISDNCRPVIQLKNYFNHQTAIILTDQESLLEHRQWIADNQAHFIIIALSHLAEKLLRSGITPDFFIAAETDENHFDHHKAIVHFEQSSILINQNYLSPLLLGNWLGTSFYTGDLVPWESSINPDNIKLNSTILEMSLGLAKHTGLSKLILFMSQVTYEHQKNHLDSVLDKLDIKLHTPLSIKHQNRLETISLAQLHVPDETVNVTDIIEKHASREKTISHYKKVKKELQETRAEIEEIYSRLKDIPHKDINKSNKLYKIAGLLSDNELDIFKDQPVRKLRAGFYQLLRHVHTSELTSDIRLLELGQLDPDIPLLEKHLDNEYNIFLDNKLNVKQNIITRRSVLNAVLSNDRSLGNTEEERIKASLFFIVLSHYGLSQQQRRLRQLETLNHDLLDISDSIYFAPGVNRALIINSQQEVIVRTYENNEDDIKYNGLEIKLYNFFVQQDTDALLKIIQSMEESDNSTENSYLHLAKGYLHELEGSIDLAIIEYGQAEAPATRESALKRITFITLEQGELEYAHHSLQILADISPEYLTQLAELYVITKNYKDALNTYTEYLNYNSDDIPVLLKIAKIYDQQEMSEASGFIYDHIRKLDPDVLH